MKKLEKVKSALGAHSGGKLCIVNGHQRLHIQALDFENRTKNANLSRAKAIAKK